MLRNRSFLAPFILLCLIAPVLLLSTTIYSQENPPDDPISPLETPQPPGGVVPGAAEYAEAFQVSEEETIRRLQLQTEMNDLVNIIAENEPQFAAAWIVHEPEFGLVVSFTTPNGEVRLRRYLEEIEWADIVHAEQSPLSHGELESIQRQLYNVDRKTDIPFESGVAFPPGKVHIYTPQPEAMNEYLQSLPSLKNRLEHIKVIYQETLSVEDTYSIRPQGAPPAPTPQSYNPQMYGGVELRTCTAGYVFTSDETNKRYISTASHCSNNQRTESTDLGRVVYEANYSHDVQFHDMFRARGVGLTNEVKLGSRTATVAGYFTRAYLYNDWVCKYGAVSAETCGRVTNTNYRPQPQGGTTFDNTFVRAERNDNTKYMGCPGDSGSPVYYGNAGDQVIAVGIFKGSPGGCQKTETYFFFSDLGNIYEKAGAGDEYEVLIRAYSPHFYQNIFYSDGSCEQYTGIPNSSGGFDDWDEIGCGSDIFAPGSGMITSYTNWVAGDKLHEAMWRGGVGYMRANDIESRRYRRLERNMGLCWQRQRCWRPRRVCIRTR